MKTKSRVLLNPTTDTQSRQSEKTRNKGSGKNLSLREDGAVTFPITVGMIDELEQAISQVKALKSMMLGRIFHPDASLQLTDMEEFGLVNLCNASFGRLDGAVEGLAPGRRSV